MSQEQTISHYQPILQAIALRMVGSLQDAEDIVQDTFVKWLTIDQAQIENTRAYLIRAVTNNCINHLNSFRKRKSEYFESLKSIDFVEKCLEMEMPRFDLENELTEALAELQKKLEPLERGVFLLRELFDFEYEDLQNIFGKKTENCRQLFSRAKGKLSDKSVTVAAQKQPPHLLESFKKACYFGQLSEFVSQVSMEVCLFQQKK